MEKKSEKRESIISYAYQPAIREIEKGLSLLATRLKEDGKEFLLTEKGMGENTKHPIEVTIYEDCYCIGELYTNTRVVKGIKVSEKGDLSILVGFDALIYTEEDLVREFEDEGNEDVHCILKDGELFTGDETLDTELAALSLLRSIDEYYS